MPSGTKKVTVTANHTLRFEWSQSSQSVSGNYSDVYWELYVDTDAYGKISLTGSQAWSVTIDGSEAGSGADTGGFSANASKLLGSGTHRVYHNSDGSKSFSFSFKKLFGFTWSGTYRGEYSGSGSGTLTTIPRASSLTAASGTLGTAQTLTISRASSSFTHTITYKCGSATGTLTTKTSSTSVSWTPPFSLAKQNTTGTSVSITLTITTYSGSTEIGSKTTAITCNIPASVKPSCKVDVTDPTGFLDTYGDYIKGQSKFKVVVTPATSYGSAIVSYSVTANGVKYTSASFTTDVLAYSGELVVSATVTDERGRSGTTSVTLTVLDCPAPKITKFTVVRCDADGSENEQGEYIKATFSATVTNLDGQNTAAYSLKYKKSTESTYTVVSLGNLANVFSATDATYIFPADSGSSYDVEISVKDNFTTVKRTTSASTAFTIMHWKADGTGMGIGKIAEESNLLDIGLLTRFYGGIKPPVLEAETDLNEVRTPNTYTGVNVSSYNYANCPVTSGTFTLLVESCGEEGQVRQTYTACDKAEPRKYVRFYYQETWGDWLWATTDEYILYDDEEGSNGTITLNADLSNYRYIEIYFTDNNGKTGGYTKVYKPDGKTICLQITEANSAVYNRQTMYTAEGTTLTPQKSVGGWYVVSASGTVTANTNTNLIKIVRVIGLA